MDKLPIVIYGPVGDCPQCQAEDMMMYGYIDYDKEVYGDLPRFVECENCGYYEELYGYDD